MPVIVKVRKIVAVSGTDGLKNVLQNACKPLVIFDKLW